MQIIFFNSKDDNIINQLEVLIGGGRFLLGDSLNVYLGEYWSKVLFGLCIKIEHNDMDYQEEYNYYMTIEENWFKGPVVDPVLEKYLADIICIIMRDNLSVKIAREIDDKLHHY